MDRNKNNDSDEQFTGKKLDEPADGEKFTGDELDEPGGDEKFAGDELDEPADGEKFTGDELDEPGGNEKFAGDELDEPADGEKFTGDELDEPVDDEKFAGDEHDEPIDDEKFAGDELDEPIDDEKFTGDELDGPVDDEQIAGNELDKTADDEELAGGKSDYLKSGKQNTSNQATEQKNITEKVTLNSNLCYSLKIKALAYQILSLFSKRKLTIVHKISATVLLVCLITVSVYFFILRQPEAVTKPIHAKRTSAKIENQTLVLDTFIVPFEHSKYYTYLLVDISVDVGGEKLRLEITEKKNKLRKIIYELLLKKIDEVQSLPPVNEVKNDIKPAINAVLENGIIKEVFITEYHAV